MELEKEITPIEATQGKTFGDGISDAAYAIDRDLASRSQAASFEGEAWLELKIDSISYIHRLVIYYKFYTNWFNPNDPCVQSENAFKTCVDDHNNVEVAVYHGELKKRSCGTLTLTEALNQSDQIYTLVCNANGDTVKFSKQSHYIVIVMAEVIILGTG